LRWDKFGKLLKTFEVGDKSDEDMNFTVLTCTDKVKNRI